MPQATEAKLLTPLPLPVRVRPGKTRPDRYLIQTFGCQMNVADTERMEVLLSEQGLSRAQNPEEAGIIIINGCSVREKAVHKALSTLGRFQFLKGESEGGPTLSASQLTSTEHSSDLATPPSHKPLIGLAGCVAQLEKEKIFEKAPYVDFVFGTDAIDQLPEIVYRARAGERKIQVTDFDRGQTYSTQTKVLENRAQAFVNIMKGCDKYCTYCIVPFTRGKEKSRTISEVLDDLANLVDRGVKEVTLLGQNVNSFGKGNPNRLGLEPRELNNRIGKVGPRDGEENFPQLLKAIDRDPRLQSLKRIRFTSSHPLDFSDELIDCYSPPTQGGVSKLAPHLHLPVQSGSNRILTKMGRHHQIENYIAQMDRLRSISPNAGISTDLIVGFPTETEQDFQETLALLDRIEFDHLYAFAYSPRPGTRAAKLPDDVPAEVKNDRLQRLLEHQKKICERKNARWVGQKIEVLVEGPSKNQNLLNPNSKDAQPGAAPHVWTGHSPCNRVVNFYSAAPRNLTGQLVSVLITASSALALQGKWEPLDTPKPSNSEPVS